MELGNIMFNESNNNQRYECPDWVVALLKDIKHRFDNIILDTQCESPFSNSGESYVCDVFEVHAYQWEGEEPQPFNFKCGEIEISWYKYMGRDDTININPDGNDFSYKVIFMYNRCLEYLRSYDD